MSRASALHSHLSEIEEMRKPLSDADKQSRRTDHLCPSARCEGGAILLGIVGNDGVVGYLSPLIKVDEAFVRKARKGRKPEERFRFSQPCIESGCGQWTGSRCGLIDRALQAADQAEVAVTPGGALPKCTIRPRCRWFAQLGRRACAVCPLVVTESASSNAKGEDKLARTFTNKTRNAAKLYDKAQQMAKVIGIQMTGDKTGGEFKGPDVAGTYRIEGDTVKVTYTKKPKDMSWAELEKRTTELILVGSI